MPTYKKPRLAVAMQGQAKVFAAYAERISRNTQSRVERMAPHMGIIMLLKKYRCMNELSL